MIQPSNLTTGDKIGIVASARKIDMEFLEPGLETIRSWGYVPVLGETIGKGQDQFAGSDLDRADDLQRMLDNADIKAILFARGGYGTVRIVDRLDWTRFKEQPKWLVGYSDLTVLHGHLQQLGFQSIHGTMPISFPENTPVSLQGLANVLAGQMPAYSIEPSPLNVEGEGSGILVGGNLSVLYSMLGSASFPQTQGNILFLEDLDEYLYHIDRMMMAFSRAGVLDSIAGILVGGMTDMNDNEIPFGKNAEQIICEHTANLGCPVVFNFPAGHGSSNEPLVLGREVQLTGGAAPSLTYS